MVSETALYDVLGLSKSATADEIKQAYRRLAKELHPDRNPGDTNAEERFKKVGQAYQVLSDPKRRALYDEFGEVGLREGFDPERARRAAAGVDFGEMFGSGRSGFGGFGFDLNDLFRSSPGAGRRAKPRDVESQIRLSFVDALKGGEHSITLSSNTGSRTIKVRIPAGIRDGERLRLRGQGANLGQIRGDLVLSVRVQNHPRLWYEGEDLHLNLPIRPLEAFEGRGVSVATPQGGVMVKIPKGAKTGAKLRLRRKGAGRGSKAPGDLIIHLEVVLPTGGEGVGEAMRTLDEALGDRDVRSDLPVL
ncbi:MAG: J domain-containing protein [Myxococcota bacterium]